MRPPAERRGAERLIAVALAALALAWGGCGRQESDTATAVTEAASGETSGSSTTVELYFPGESGRLEREKQEIPAAESATDRIRQLVEALLAGPGGKGLYAPLPTGIRLAAVHVTPSGVAYIDLETADDGEPPSMGTRGELLAVYSIVDSIVLNVGEVDAVVLLWNGRQQFSFAGHVDTAGPLSASLDLVAGR